MREILAVTNNNGGGDWESIISYIYMHPAATDTYLIGEARWRTAPVKNSSRCSVTSLEDGRLVDNKKRPTKTHL